MSPSLSTLSESISRLVEQAAPLLSAIRIGPARHVTGLVCPTGEIVTTDQALPALDSYTVVLSNRSVAMARPGVRDPLHNLASLKLDSAMPVSLPAMGAASLGGLVLVLGADVEASPTVRLAVIHRFLRTAAGDVAMLDLAAAALDPGSLVLDADGHLLGLAAYGANGESIAIPAAGIASLFLPGGTRAAAISSPQRFDAPGRSYGRKAWLGIALQPIVVPPELATRTGQTSGRMVVNIATGGPADRAGMRVGDVLLSLNGCSLSGQHGLRTVLAEETIGSAVEIKLLRDGNLMTAHPVVAVQP
nr:S1C family serine protease [uncultured Rhodopila sp.]